VIIAEHRVTDTELRALMVRARAAGDTRLAVDALVAIEGVAAAGRTEARKRCVAAIADRRDV